MSSEIKPGIRRLTAGALHLYDTGFSEQFGQRVVTAAAVALAIAVVSGVGLLMGMQ